MLDETHRNALEALLVGLYLEHVIAPPHLVVHEDELLGVHGDEIDAVRAMLFMCNKGCAVVAQ
ncbi:MAG TPA: hypothetical protein DCP66_05835 [Collinsella sp.]|nr:hypothetical protein [Collinsella sp.]